jgi:hypothetical protein
MLLHGFWEQGFGRVTACSIKHMIQVWVVVALTDSASGALAVSSCGPWAAEL